MNKVLFCIIALSFGFAHGQDVVIGEKFIVDSQLLFTMVCASDDEIQRLDSRGEIRIYDKESFLESRQVVRENILDPQWTPNYFQEKDDHCTVVEVVLSKQKACDGISIDRLKAFYNANCDALTAW